MSVRSGSAVPTSGAGTCAEGSGAGVAGSGVAGSGVAGSGVMFDQPRGAWIGHGEFVVGRPLHKACVVDGDVGLVEQGQSKRVDGGGDRSTAIGDDVPLAEQPGVDQMGMHGVSVYERGCLCIDERAVRNVHRAGDVTGPGPVGRAGAVEAVGRQSVDQACWRLGAVGIDPLYRSEHVGLGGSGGFPARCGHEWRCFWDCRGLVGQRPAFGLPPLEATVQDGAVDAVMVQGPPRTGAPHGAGVDAVTWCSSHEDHLGFRPHTNGGERGDHLVGSRPHPRKRGVLIRKHALACGHVEEQRAGNMAVVITLGLGSVLELAGQLGGDIENSNVGVVELAGEPCGCHEVVRFGEVHAPLTLITTARGVDTPVVGGGSATQIRSARRFDTPASVRWLLRAVPLQVDAKC